jgi:hypothetical protein
MVEDPEAANSDKTIAVSPIFCSQLDLIERLNVWGEGPVLVGKKGQEEEAQQFIDPMGKQQGLNIDILFDISGGMEQLHEYFETTRLTGDLENLGDAEKAIKLTVTPVKICEMDEQRKVELARLTSTSSSLLENHLTVALMKARLRMLQEKYDYLSAESIPRDSMKKEEFAKALAKFHTTIRQKDPSFEDSIK